MASSQRQDLSRVVGADLLTSSGEGSNFIIKLILHALWRSCVTIGLPFKRIFAIYFWAARTGSVLGRFTVLQLLSLVGWLNGPAFGRFTKVSRVSRNMVGLNPKRWHVALAGFMGGTLVSTVIHRWMQRHNKLAIERLELQAKMQKATDYQAWTEAADRIAALDNALAPARGRQQRRTRLYDEKLLREKIDHLKAVRKAGVPREMMFALRIDLIRNIANVAKSQVPGECHQVPETITRYLQEVREQLTLLAEWPEHELSAEDKLSFFKQTRLAYGRTALLLGGGGGLGTFHIGVVKTLFEHKMLPRVLAGSSVGSIVCAMICTKTDPELHVLLSNLDTFEIVLFNNSMDTWSMSRNFLHSGSLQDMGHLIKQLRTLIGDQTFLEAYERTGRILNVTVCPADTNEPPRLLNYCTAPQALIWSAVAASSAFPGLFPPQNIVARNSEGRVVLFSQHSTNDTLERRWRDGSLELDLPVQALSEMFQCNHFLVSQTNPHIVPLMNLKKMLPNNWGKIMEAEIKHRRQVIQGMLSSPTTVSDFCRQLRMSGVRCQVLQWMLPDWVPSKWLMLFTQPWAGDITMTLPPELWHLGRTIRNPTPSELIRAVKVGERCTWENLSTIECNCTIEATLDECVATITNKVRSSPMRGLGKSLPSWLHMTSVGMPSVASWGENAFASGRSSCSGGSLAGGSVHGGVSTRHTPASNAEEEDLADSASENMPRRRASTGSNVAAMAHSGLMPMEDQVRPPSVDFVRPAAASRARDVSTPSLLPRLSAALGVGGGGSNSPSNWRWEMSSDDGVEFAGERYVSGRGRCSSSLRNEPLRDASTPTLPGSLIHMATMDCTDDSAGGSGVGGVRSVWGAMFGVASSSNLAAGHEQGGFGMDLLQY